MAESLTIYQAMAAILADVDHIGKDHKADMGNAGKYNFRGIDDIYNALHSSFAKYKVFILPEVLESKIEIQEKEKSYNGVTTKTYACSAILKIKFTFASEDGSSISAIGIGQALDQSDKAASKAQSNALKYCLMQTFLIPTEESKDIENDNIPVSRPPTAPKRTDTAIDASRQATRECFAILGWEKDRVLEWSAKINPAPFDSWTLENWRSANTKALMEINTANE
jgi:hypothetical protein